MPRGNRWEWKSECVHRRDGQGGLEKAYREEEKQQSDLVELFPYLSSNLVEFNIHFCFNLGISYKHSCTVHKCQQVNISYFHYFHIRWYEKDCWSFLSSRLIHQIFTPCSLNDGLSSLFQTVLMRYKRANIMVVYSELHCQQLLLEVKGQSLQHATVSFPPVSSTLVLPELSLPHQLYKVLCSLVSLKFIAYQTAKKHWQSNRRQ